MACVPGGNVIAKASGSPGALAALAIGLSAFGSACTLPFSAAFSVMAWPLRFIIQGMTIGFFGEPRRPIVEAMGMPISMCVACRSPVESESRMAAQLAPLLTVDSMPYFLNRPFSCAITIGEQSVRAIIPNFIADTSGDSLAHTRPAGKRAAPSAAVLTWTNRRRDFTGASDTRDPVRPGGPPGWRSENRGGA